MYDILLNSVTHYCRVHVVRSLSVSVSLSSLWSQVLERTRYFGKLLDFFFPIPFKGVFSYGHVYPCNKTVDGTSGTFVEGGPTGTWDQVIREYISFTLGLHSINNVNL